MGISANIKNLRDERGWTQEQLAKKLDVARSTVTQWEMGWTRPRMGMVEKLASVFNVTPADMVADDSVTYSLVNLDDLTQDERELLDIYRSMDTRARHDLLRIAASLSAARNIDSGLSASA